MSSLVCALVSVSGVLKLCLLRVLSAVWHRDICCELFLPDELGPTD